MNRLYFGDNLDVLRNKIRDESVDLVYLDPPFKSDANYNVLFKDTAGEPFESQAGAFRDTWEWGDAARDAYADIDRANGDLALIASSFRKWMGENAMTAYHRHDGSSPSRIAARNEGRRLLNLSPL